MILAFQSTIPLERFGAAIFVVDLVGIAVTRELGPLITAIILAGRTGSAFAAELGTMKVNEELNAIDTMGLEPVQFLIVPRVIAAVLMTPLLVILSNAAAIAGGLIVMRSVGFTWVTLIHQLQQAVSLGDVFGGLFKSLFFGMLVAGIGCLRGLETATGAQAVGVSATRPEGALPSPVNIQGPGGDGVVGTLDVRGLGVIRTSSPVSETLVVVVSHGNEEVQSESVAHLQVAKHVGEDVVCDRVGPQKVLAPIATTRTHALLSR